MNKIEKLDIKEYQVPTNLETRGEGRGSLLWATGVIDRMLDKLDELVERVNELAEVKDEMPGSPGREAPRSPRPRYLPHDKEG